MTDIRELLHAGAHRPSAAPDLDRIARDTVRKRTSRSAGIMVAVAAVVALAFGVDWVGSTTVEITEPVGTVTVPRLPRVDPSAAPAAPDTITVLDEHDGATPWELGFGIDPAGSMLHLLFSAGGSSAGTRMPVDASGRVWPGSLTTSDQGQFAYGTSAPEVAAFELEVADGTQVDVPATRVHVDDPLIEFTTFAVPVTDYVTRITARNRNGDIVAVYDRDDPVGVVLFQVLQDQPWLASSDDGSPRPPFEPTTFQDQYVVTTSVAMELFGERAAGGRLADGRIELAVTRATPADTDRLRAELSTDPRLADAADRFTIAPIEHTRDQLDAAQADLRDDVPDDLRQRISVTVEPHEDRVTIYVADERDAAAVREAIAELPDFVHIVIDPKQQGHPADS